MKHFVIGIVGNPNCGKTTLFNVLTGTKQRVGNWPGVTVERKVGNYHFAGSDIEIVDLPGIYSLDLTHDVTSLDEQITQDYILSGEPHLIVNITDGSNLDRNLYLTTQLLDMGVPMMMAVNMMDIAQQRNIVIDLEGLSKQLGMPVVPIMAAKGGGVETLKKVILQAVQNRTLPSLQITYPKEIEEAIVQLLPLVQPLLPNAGENLTGLRDLSGLKDRLFTLKLLENDHSITKWATQSLMDTATQLRHGIEKQLGEDVDILIADRRYGVIAKLIEKTVTKTTQVTRTRSDQIDKIVLNRIVGIPIFLAVMYLMFMFTINLGGAFIDFFDILVGTLLVDGVGHLLQQIGTPVVLITLLAGGIGGGIQVVATFIPIIGFLFLCLSFLEDSGYMARAAFVMDRFMRFIGLPGKSFVPLIVGFGCNVPAVMATRTLERQRDRFLTILMTPFMSCGARLPVYALFAVAFFPVGGQNVVFGLYLIGIAVAILTGLIMKKTILRGEVADFFMELPPYHLPTLQNVLLHTWGRLKSFIFTAGKMIVPMVMLLTFLNSWGTDGSFGNEDSQKSVLSEIGRTLTPVFQPMGLQEDNWPATVGIFTGILAKEAVVGTLNALYTQMAGTQTQAEVFEWWGGIRDAFATIPANLGEVTNQLLDPLGLSRETAVATTAQAEHAGAIGAMTSHFAGPVGAFAFLLFILLYTPCAATIAAIYQETQLRWTLFVVCWTTGLAYLVATVFYQLATFAQHPWQSFGWTAGLIGLLGLTVLAMYDLGSVRRRELNLTMATGEN